MIGSRLCVPATEELKRKILEEAHSSASAMHPDSTKMYHTLKGYYWWSGMKREVAEYVSKHYKKFTVYRQKLPTN